MKIKELSPSKQIIIANKINEAKFKMTKAEQKLFLYCVGMVDNNPETLESALEIPIIEFAKYLEIDTRVVYRDVKSITKRFQSRYIEFEHVEKGFIRVINIVSYIDYYEEGKKIILKINNDFRPYLIGLKSHFTKYSLQETIQLKSVYSMRLYQILSQWVYKQKVEYSVEKLRFILNIEDGEYKLYGDFKRKVLEVAYKEINKSSSIRFTYKEVKTGRKITDIEFTLTKAIKPDKDSIPEVFQEPKESEKRLVESEVIVKSKVDKIEEKHLPNFIIPENQPIDITDEEFISFITNPKTVILPKTVLSKVPEVVEKSDLEHKKVNNNSRSIASLSEQFIELEGRLTRLGFASSKSTELIKNHGIDYLLFVLEKSKIESRDKVDNKAGYFQTVVNTYQESYKAQIEALDAQKIQSNLNLKLKEKRNLEIKQKETEFEQEQEAMSRKILENEPEIFCKTIYHYMQTFIVDMQFGFSAYPDYDDNRINGNQVENQRIAREIRCRFLICQSLKDFTNLIKYDEDWLFKAVFYSQAHFDKRDPTYYKSKVSLAKLERVELPFII